MKFKELNNGVKIPEIGYGVYRIPENDKTKECVLKALKAGYRHIDTAQVYLNEKEVGDAIKESGIANIIIRYLLDNNIVVLSTTKEERMKSNQDVYSFSLTAEERKIIKEMNTETSLFLRHEDAESSKFFLELEKNI